jgi:hypothetical protein
VTPDRPTPFFARFGRDVVSLMCKSPRLRISG